MASRSWECFNTNVGETCLMPFHLHEGQSGLLIATALHPGKTPRLNPGKHRSYAGEVIVAQFENFEFTAILVKIPRKRFPRLRIPILF